MNFAGWQMKLDTKCSFIGTARYGMDPITSNSGSLFAFSNETVEVNNATTAHVNDHLNQTSSTPINNLATSSQVNQTCGSGIPYPSTNGINCVTSGVENLYVFVTQYRTWWWAKSACESVDGTLLYSYNRSQAGLRNLIAHLGSQNFRVGVRKEHGWLRTADNTVIEEGHLSDAIIGSGDCMCRGLLLGQCFLSSGRGRDLLQDEDHSGSRPHSFPGYYLMRSG